MKKLIELLLIETKPLKELFLERSEKYASHYYDVLVKRSKWDEIDWCLYFGLEPRPVNVGSSAEFLSFPKGFYGTKESKTYYTLRNEALRVKHISKESFIEKELKKAEQHYETSIQKLAFRLMKKELDLDNLTLDTQSIGVNINTTISDGNKTVRAWTIVAEGEIQRPHYRYLIK